MRVWRSIDGFILLTSFRVEYGLLSGPGAEVGEHLERANATSSVIRGGGGICGLSLGGGANGCLRGKKWSTSITLAGIAYLIFKSEVYGFIG